MIDALEVWNSSTPESGAVCNISNKPQIAQKAVLAVKSFTSSKNPEIQRNILNNMQAGAETQA